MVNIAGVHLGNGGSGFGPNGGPTRITEVWNHKGFTILTGPDGVLVIPPGSISESDIYRNQRPPAVESREMTPSNLRSEGNLLSLGEVYETVDGLMALALPGGTTLIPNRRILRNLWAPIGFEMRGHEVLVSRVPDENLYVILSAGMDANRVLSGRPGNVPTSLLRVVPAVGRIEVKEEDDKYKVWVDGRFIGQVDEIDIGPGIPDETDGLVEGFLGYLEYYIDGGVLSVDEPAGIVLGKEWKDEILKAFESYFFVADREKLLGALEKYGRALGGDGYGLSL